MSKKNRAKRKKAQSKSAPKQNRSRKHNNARGNPFGQVPDYERVEIKGAWSVLSPMHIGSGFQSKRPVLDSDNSLGTAEVACFCQDMNGMPYIPATTLRGMLRSVISRIDNEADQILLEALLGYSHEAQDPETNDSEIAPEDLPNFHSRLRIYDARSNTKSSISHISEEFSNKPRISTHVVIDPLTRTAKEGLLFSQQEVPAGEEFGCVIELDRVSHEELQAVSRLLQTLNSDSTGLRIGNGANKLQGRLCWKFNDFFQKEKKIKHVRGVKGKSFINWLENLSFLIKKNQYESGTGVSFEGLYDAINNLDFKAYQVSDTALQIPMQIFPQSPLLIPDVNASKKHLRALLKDQKEEGGITLPEEDEKGITANRRVSTESENEKPEKRLIIPGSSLLGAFRAQCRKILMTLAFEMKIAGKDIKTMLSFSAINQAVDYLLEQYFGRTGERSKIWISEAVSAHTPKEHRQYFNSIDRFTGGAADGALFNSIAYTCEYLRFTIRLDSRLFSENGGGIALVAFALRDAVEGDITLGGGSSHGYGRNFMAVANTDTSNGVVEKNSWQTNLQQLYTLFRRIAEKIDLSAEAKVLEEKLAKTLEQEVKQAQEA